MNSSRDRTARNLLNQKLTSLSLKLAEAIQQLSEYSTLQSEVKTLERVKAQIDNIETESETGSADVEVKNLTTQDAQFRDASVAGNFQVTASRFLIDGIPIKEYIHLRVAKELDARDD